MNQRTLLWPVSDRATPPAERLPAKGETFAPTFRRGREALAQPGVLARASCLLLLIALVPVLSAAEPPPAAPASPQRIHRLIEALGDTDYFVRQKAEADLGKIGFEALDALTAATQCDDMEIVTRANRLLCVIRSNWTVPGEPAIASNILAGYECAG